MPSTLNCRITKIDVLTENIRSFEIEAIDDKFTKPKFDNLEAGAHIDVYLDDGLIRQYSLWNWSQDKQKIYIAVKREDQGNGGSVKMHQLKVGDSIAIDGPRNHFKLKHNAPHYTLIAGGIGVTPIFAMARELAETNAKVDVYYLVQKQEFAAFSSHFENLGLNNHQNSSYQLHCDDKKGLFDISGLLQTIPKDSVIYTCGPEPMLNSIIDSVTTHDLHFERFTLATDEAEKENNSFQVKINSTGAVYTVDKDETILSVLSDNGIDVPSACAAGLCGTCITDVLEGEIEHRDSILSDDEKASNEYMCVCISRAKSDQITLDI